MGFFLPIEFSVRLTAGLMGDRFVKNWLKSWLGSLKSAVLIDSVIGEFYLWLWIASLSYSVIVAIENGCVI